MSTRRTHLLFILLIASILAACDPSTNVTPATTPNPRGSIVGAIRWDGWVGEMPTFGDATSNNRVGLIGERTLGPKKWHYRLPFYAVELDENQVQVRDTTQAIIDQEIAYAKNAGIDYWAFVFYPKGSGLDTARSLYLSSTHKADVKFCLIIADIIYLKDPELVALYISYFRMAAYQKVLGGRPLLYLLNLFDVTEEGNTAIKQAIDNLRQQTTTAGLASPYIVYMGWETGQVKVYVGKFGLDAASAYATIGSNGVPFSNLVKAGESGWDTYRRAQLKIIPWVTSGWDPRPRIDTPDPRVSYKPTSWVQTAVPEEVARHLQDAIQWNAKYPGSAEANAVIIYAWNEFDEGGWICPTLKNGSDRLDAIRKILKGQ